jgi:hypothetical protein
VVVGSTSGSPSAEASADPGSIGVRLIAAPGPTSDNPTALDYIIEQMGPGTTVTRAIEVSNTSDRAQRISVYAAGADVVRGEFEFDSGHDRNDLSSWTSVNRDTVDLVSGGQAQVTVSIRVPASASAGERDAVVWAEASAPAPTGTGIELVNRDGVRMYVGVGPGGLAPPEFTIGNVTGTRSATGLPLVTTYVHNVGRSPFAINGTVGLTGGPGGSQAGPVPATLDRILAPGASEPVTARFGPTLPRGPWRGTVTLTSGTTEISKAGSVTFTARAAERSGWSTPVTVGIILLVFVAGSSVALLTARRRARRFRHGHRHARR